MRNSYIIPTPSIVDLWLLCQHIQNPGLNLGTAWGPAKMLMFCGEGLQLASTTWCKVNHLVIPLTTTIGYQANVAVLII